MHRSDVLSWRDFPVQTQSKLIATSMTFLQKYIQQVSKVNGTLLSMHVTAAQSIGLCHQLHKLCPVKIFYSCTQASAGKQCLIKGQIVHNFHFKRLIFRSYVIKPADVLLPKTVHE